MQKYALTLTIFELQKLKLRKKKLVEVNLKLIKKTFVNQFLKIQIFSVKNNFLFFFTPAREFS